MTTNAVWERQVTIDDEELELNAIKTDDGDTEKTVIPEEHPPHMYYNIILLALCWCFGISAFFTLFSSATMMTKDMKGASASSIPIGAALTTGFFAVITLPMCIGKFGHRWVYIPSACLGVVGSILCIVSSLYAKDDIDIAWALLVTGCALQGPQYACTNSYRLQVPVFATPQFVPKALSLVVGGGLLAVVLGPELGKTTRTSMDDQFEGTYIMLMCQYLLLIFTLALIYWPPKRDQKRSNEASMEQERNLSVSGSGSQVVSENAGTGGHREQEQEEEEEEEEQQQQQQQQNQQQAVDLERQGTQGHHDGSVSISRSKDERQNSVIPSTTTRVSGTESAKTSFSPSVLWSVISNPVFLEALLFQVISFVAMGALMMMTPVSMKENDYSHDAGVTAISIHMVGMYAPSFITGDMINRLGANRVIFIGFLTLLLGAVLFLLGTMKVHYYLGIFLVGVGWNWAFVASTAIFSLIPYTELQGRAAHMLNDLVVIGLMAVFIMISGTMYMATGWDTFVWIWVIVVCIPTLLSFYRLLRPLTLVT